MRRALILLACLTTWSTPTTADTPIDLAPCLGIPDLLPAAITDLEILSCRDDISPQTRAELTYLVPPDQVEPLATRLEADYAMAPLRFMCCGYETSQPGEIPIPDGHFPRSVQQQLTADYNAIVTVLQITLSAPAFPLGETASDAGPLPLGALHGLLTLTLSDI